MHERDFFTTRPHDAQLTGTMNPLEEHERKIIIEFCHLLEKSKQLFNGLRELPQYGHKQWHSYFGRTFDVYTKLWKFQQLHRAVLDTKYGLKRWQIGEIASKIGQLYYHFYLRTSETSYLTEAFAFYCAIRSRCYYTKASKEDKCELMVKKLRYHARFIVVCLLLKKIKMVRELIWELDRLIAEYGYNYDPDDQMEWNVVLDEVKAFMNSEPAIKVVDPDNRSNVIRHRLRPVMVPPVERTQSMSLTLQEVVIVGSSSRQVKFSELTLDMFRMLQTLEREPLPEIKQLSIYDDSPKPKNISTPNAPLMRDRDRERVHNEDGMPRRDNPHKYLLFKPSPSQLLVYLASGCNELPPGGALLLYISADGHIVQPSKNPEEIGWGSGGLITTSRSDIYRECNKDQKSSSVRYKENSCLHPGDLYPFTRKPLFIIIDSDNSHVFQNMPRHFGQPLVILMSPIEYPQQFHDRKNKGNLFTLFIHCPMTAFCHLCDIDTISVDEFQRGQMLIDTFLAEALQLVMRSRIDNAYINFIGDDFLRLLFTRYMFCEVAMRSHKAFRGRTNLTRASPPIPEEILKSQNLMRFVMDMAAHMQVRNQFIDPSSSERPSHSKE